MKPTNLWRGTAAALVLAALAPALFGEAPPVVTLTLDQAHAVALRRHPAVAMARLEELVAHENVVGQESNYLPEATAFADAVAAGNRDTRILAGGLNNPSIYDRVADGVEVSELLTDFGRTANLVGSARLNAQAAEQQAAATDQQILLNVDVNYFNALEAQAVLKVAQDTVRARRYLAEQVGALARAQIKSQLDVSFAQVAVSQSELLLEQAQNGSDSAQASLAAALGYRRLRLFVLTAQPPAQPAEPDVDVVIDEAMQHRPDLLRLRFAQQAAERAARADRDANYPTLSAVGTAGNAMSHQYELPDRYVAGGVELSIPLFAGGSYLARQRAAEDQAQIAGEALRQQEDRVSRDVRQAWLNFNTALQSEATTEDLLRHANEAYELAQARYKVGSSSIVALSDAQLAATQAQIAEANARYNVMIQQSVLRYQMGLMQ